MCIGQFGARLPEGLRYVMPVERIKALPALDDKSACLEIEKVRHDGCQAIATNGEVRAFAEVETCPDGVAADYLVDDLSSATVGLRLEMPASLAREAESERASLRTSSRSRASTRAAQRM